ncbi:MAG: ATP-binding cassette domain-containing protein, partial [Spirochaetaceae bacterium]|nr:ATP-binding cassette domain-containing protein [Spirochaetaceae bacterium]
RLNEVFRIATHVAIMRDGVITLHGRAEEFSRETLVRGLLPEGLSPEGLLPEGREEEGARRGAPERKAPDYAERRPVLELRDYSGWGFADINLKVYPGEVLGLCGVVGAGRTELAMTIYGRDRVKSGRAFLDGEDITGLGTRRIIRKGVNYVPEDRFLNGVFPITGIAGNMSSALLGFLPGFLLNFRAEAGLAGRYLEEFRIRAAGPRQEMGSLSGGNQQKVVIGRALSTEPRLVIMDEPTRGIDAGARGDIYAIIAELKARNVAVLLISSDMEEIVELSDRAVTMFQGRINREFQREEITQDRLMSASFGLAGEAG